MLNEKGIPTPLVHAMLFPPRSRMDILTEAEIDNVISHSKLVAKYNQAIDSDSAYEILTGKLQQATQQAEQQKQVQQQQKATGRTAKKDDSFFDNPAVKQIERTAASVLTRSLLGVLGLGGRRKSIF
jgi:hypothetical protein